MPQKSSSANKRIAKNTFFLFFRTLLIMCITLYTSRVVLNVLGVSDYGIYNVVGGVVSMLVFLNSALVQATQRYINFAQGEENIDNQIKVFSTSILANLTIALVVVIIMETLGVWYVNHKVVLPEDRLFAANIVFQASTLIFISKIVIVPFTASVIAHEHMHIYAYISIADAVLQLIITFLLNAFFVDKLILYALLQLCVAVLHFIFYYAYCKHYYVECVYKKVTDWTLYKEMYAFAGWAFVGGFGYVARGQGVNLILNLFCGPGINAARAVAYQVCTAIQTFVSSFLQAINPPITKKYAKGDVNSMMLLVKVGSKYTFLALLICCTPVLIRSEYILDLWLGKAPEYSSEFLYLALLMSLVTSMGGPLTTAMQATGNIRLFQIVVTIIMCLDIPFSYFLLVEGIEPYLVTAVSVVTAFFCLIAKLVLLNRLVPFDIKSFFVNVVAKNIVIALTIIPILSIIANIIPLTFGGFIIICFMSIAVYGGVIWLCCLDNREKDMIYVLFNKLKTKYFVHDV